MFARAIYAAAFLVAVASPRADAFEVSVVHGRRTLDGVVTYAEEGGNLFFLATGGGECWRCAMVQGSARVAVGDVVEVAGEVLPQTVNNRIDYCEAKVLGHDESRVPEP